MSHHATVCILTDTYTPWVPPNVFKFPALRKGPWVYLIPGAVIFIFLMQWERGHFPDSHLIAKNDHQATSILFGVYTHGTSNCRSHCGDATGSYAQACDPCTTATSSAYHGRRRSNSIYRNSTECYKSIVQVEVFSSSGALCFNKKLYHNQTIPVSTNSKLVCHYLGALGEMDDFSIYWYKDCKLLQSGRFVPFGEELLIKNVREDDKGKYQCRGSYSYLGHKYNFSRSILVSVTGNEWKRTEILYPRNNTIEAELGSNVFTQCNVSSFRNTFISVSWRVNYTLVDVLFKGRIQEGIQKDYIVNGAWLSVVSLNITKLERADYNQWFVCHAGEVAAYISIQPPTKNFTGLAALVLLILIPILICLLLKMEIVLWYRKTCRPFCCKNVSDGKIYDAYVLYPKSDTPNHFALKVLPEVLEKQCGYNLFILGRNDLPGKAVASVVDETVQQSRRLIIIVVPGLPCPEEATEQHIAMYHALVPAGMKVILIEMGKIKDYSSMPESIRYIKQKHGAIRWKGDLAKRSAYSAHSKFWKKVRYQMPPEGRISPALSLGPTSLNTCEMTEIS